MIFHSQAELDEMSSSFVRICRQPHLSNTMEFLIAQTFVLTVIRFETETRPHFRNEQNNRFGTSQIERDSFKHIKRMVAVISDGTEGIPETRHSIHRQIFTPS